MGAKKLFNFNIVKGMEYILMALPEAGIRFDLRLD